MLGTGSGFASTAAICLQSTVTNVERYCGEGGWGVGGKNMGEKRWQILTRSVYVIFCATSKKARVVRHRCGIP